MTDTADATTPDSIRIALEAAEAATDAASEAQGLRMAAETALARLDRSTGRIGPLLVGCLVGSVAVLALGGLFHLRTMADMRTATAAQIEALALFSTRVGTLDGQLAAVAGMTDRLAALETQTTTLTTGLDAAMATALADHAARITAEHEATRAAASQATTALLDAILTTQTATTEAITAGASDLQLALSRMLAAGLPAASPSAAAPPPAAQAAPAPRPTPTASPAPRPAPARAAAPANPFSFP